MRVTSHVRGGPLGGHSGPGSWSRCFLVLGPFRVPLSPSPCSATSPYLARPPASIPASDGPPWLLGSLYSPPSLEDPRGGYGFSETPPGALSLVLTQGKGCVWQKQLYKYGCRGGAPPESLGEFADDANQGCVLILEPLVVSPEVGQGL